jgi:hypothetical protein
VLDFDTLTGLYVAEVPYPKDYDHFVDICEWLKDNAPDDYSLPVNVVTRATFIDEVCYTHAKPVVEPKWHVFFADIHIAVWFKLTWQ